MKRKPTPTKKERRATRRTDLAERLAAMKALAWLEAKPLYTYGEDRHAPAAPTAQVMVDGQVVCEAEWVEAPRLGDPRR